MFIALYKIDISLRRSDMLEHDMALLRSAALCSRQSINILLLRSKER
jgi:hypothetical protein